MNDLVRIGEHYVNPAHVESLEMRRSTTDYGLSMVAVATMTSGRTFTEALTGYRPEVAFSRIVARFNA